MKEGNEFGLFKRSNVHRKNKSGASLKKSECLKKKNLIHHLLANSGY